MKGFNEEWGNGCWMKSILGAKSLTQKKEKDF
jgi:hypothetical protein